MPPRLMLTLLHATTVKNHTVTITTTTQGTIAPTTYLKFCTKVDIRIVVVVGTDGIYPIGFMQGQIHTHGQARTT